MLVINGYNLILKETVTLQERLKEPTFRNMLAFVVEYSKDFLSFDIKANIIILLYISIIFYKKWSWELSQHLKSHR